MAHQDDEDDVVGARTRLEPLDVALDVRARAAPLGIVGGARQQLDVIAREAQPVREHADHVALPGLIPRAVFLAPGSTSDDERVPLVRASGHGNEQAGGEPRGHQSRARHLSPHCRRNAHSTPASSTISANIQPVCHQSRHSSGARRDVAVCRKRPASSA